MSFSLKLTTMVRRPTRTINDRLVNHGYRNIGHSDNEYEWGKNPCFIRPWHRALVLKLQLFVAVVVGRLTNHYFTSLSPSTQKHRVVRNDQSDQNPF